METVDLSIIPDKVSPVVHASQYDEGRVQRFMLLDRACPYTLSGEETIELRIRKPNNQTEMIEIENSGGDYINLPLTTQITDIAGDVYCKFSIDDISTKGFYIKVEPGPARIYTGYADGEIAEFETDLEENIIVLNVELSPIQDFNGYDAPWAPGCGKNLACLNSNTLFQTKNSTVSYTDDNNVSVSVNGTYAQAEFELPCIIGQTYTISFDGICTANYKRVYISKTALSPTQSGNYYSVWTLSANEELHKSVTFTAEYSSVAILFYVSTTADPGTMTIKNFQMEKGSTETTFEPYSNICPISGRTTAKMFRNSGNLVDDSIKYVYSGNIVYIGANNSGYNIFLKAGTYRASVDFSGERYGFYCKSEDISNIAIWGSNTGAHESTFVIPKDGYYRFWVYYNPSLGTIDANKIKWVKIEPGNVTTPYEPYVLSPTPVTISFDQTVYSGVIDYTSQVIRAVGKLVKISDYTWTRNAQYGMFVIGINDMKYNPDSGKKLDGLVSEAYVNRTAAQAGSQRVNNSIAAWQNQLRIRDDTYDNVTDFVNAMGNIHFLYPLKTPIEIPFSGYTPIPTLKGKNIVYSDSGPVEVAYRKSTPDGRR